MTQKTENDKPTFAELGARPETVASLAAMGIERAFAIQEYALPIAMRGGDLIGQAPTGTGKTLGFGVPLLERVLTKDEGADGMPQALIVVPTRELGLQVAKDLQGAGKVRGVRVLPIYGGVAYEPQVEQLKKGVEILVGTPGRLLDLAKQKHLKLDRVRALVLDEADRMLDLGFLDDVEKILAMLPEERQTMLFSATMPDPIVALSRRFLRNPVTVHAGHATEPGLSPQTKQLVYRTHQLNKLELLGRILQANGRGLTMIFTRTKRNADRVCEDLDFRGFAAAAIHGDLGQGARERALRAFRAGKVDVVVCTDVASRGIDVTDVTHVINYDCPDDAESYVHRIGRTGRAGAKGTAVTFVDWEDMPRWRLIEKTHGLELPDPPETYHTSPWVYTDLDIPTDVTGTLPTANRSRAGLSAEVEEDLSGGRGRGGRGRKGPSTRDDAPKAPRQRRRRKINADEDAPAEAGAAATDEAAPRRRRRKVTAEDAVAPSANAAETIDADTAAPRRRRADTDTAEAGATTSRRRKADDVDAATDAGPSRRRKADADTADVDAGTTTSRRRKADTDVEATGPSRRRKADVDAADAETTTSRRRRSAAEEATSVSADAADTVASDAGTAAPRRRRATASTADNKVEAAAAPSRRPAKPEALFLAPSDSPASEDDDSDVARPRRRRRRRSGSGAAAAE